MYTVDINKPTTSTFIAQTKWHLVAFDTWYRHLDHAGADTICEMIKDQLVDGLTVHGDDGGDKSKIVKYQGVSFYQRQG